MPQHDMYVHATEALRHAYHGFKTACPLGTGAFEAVTSVPERLGCMYRLEGDDGRCPVNRQTNVCNFSIV
jgi:hypothetical protein